MLSWLIATHFPHLQRKADVGQGSVDLRHREFFREVVVRTAKLVADWQLVGFTHGVLNTDNSNPPISNGPTSSTFHMHHRGDPIRQAITGIGLEWPGRWDGVRRGGGPSQ